MVTCAAPEEANIEKPFAAQAVLWHETALKPGELQCDFLVRNVSAKSVDLRRVPTAYVVTYLINGKWVTQHFDRGVFPDSVGYVTLAPGQVRHLSLPISKAKEWDGKPFEVLMSVGIDANVDGKKRTCIVECIVRSPLDETPSEWMRQTRKNKRRNSTQVEAQPESGSVGKDRAGSP